MIGRGPAASRPSPVAAPPELYMDCYRRNRTPTSSIETSQEGQFHEKQIGVVLAIAVVACGIYAAVAAASSSSEKVVTKNVTVTMVDFHFKLSFAGPYKHGVKYVFKTSTKAMPCTTSTFRGSRPARSSPPGKTYTFPVVFKKAGKYPFLCDVPRHAELGMSGNLTVK